MKFSADPAGIPNTPVWEKILGISGFFLLCFGFCYFIWVALTEQNQPAEISFHVAEINVLKNGFLVQIDIANMGSQSIAALNFEGRLESQQGEPEVSSATVDYVPAHSVSHAGLYFSSDPRLGELELKALGYQEP